MNRVQYRKYIASHKWAQQTFRTVYVLFSIFMIIAGLYVLKNPAINVFLNATKRGITVDGKVIHAVNSSSEVGNKSPGSSVVEYIDSKTVTCEGGAGVGDNHDFNSGAVIRRTVIYDRKYVNIATCKHDTSLLIVESIVPLFGLSVGILGLYFMLLKTNSKTYRSLVGLSYPGQNEEDSK